MQHLYAPWRGTYAKKANDHNHQLDGCPFCNQIASDLDAEHFIIKRLKHTTVMLNKYPYNPGHLLIVPNEHVASLDRLSNEAQNELMNAITTHVTLLTTQLKASGINVGINLGDHASGGSIPDHLHVHLVPRWHGDTNFLPVIAETKPLSTDLQEVYAALTYKIN
jgi:ATP adenylyltransferase